MFTCLVTELRSPTRSERSRRSPPGGTYTYALFLLFDVLTFLFYCTLFDCYARRVRQCQEKKIASNMPLASEEYIFRLPNDSCRIFDNKSEEITMKDVTFSASTLKYWNESQMNRATTYMSKWFQLLIYFTAEVFLS